MITVRTIEDVVRRHISRLSTAVSNGTIRGVLTGNDDSTGLSRGQSSTDEDDLVDDVEFVTPYGLSANPGTGAETLMWSIGGSARHLLGMVFDRRVRLKGALAAGEVALHIGNEGQVVHLKTDGEIVVAAGTDGGTITVKPNGDIVILPGAGGSVYLGDGAATKKVALADDVDARFESIKTTFNTHTHPTAPVGPVSPPSGLIAVLAPTASTNVYGKG